MKRTTTLEFPCTFIRICEKGRFLFACMRIIFALRPFFERLDANLNIKYNAYYKAPCSALEPVQSRR